MGKEAIVERILSDAHAEAESIRKDAEEKAAAILAAALARSQEERIKTEAEVKEKTESILSRRAAAARLDSQKLVLKEKRRVLDAVYETALNRLKTLPKEDLLKLTESLLRAYADEGDEVVFAENYPHADSAANLPIFEERKLKISKRRAPLDGGFLLVGKKSDKDLSFGALLKADREEHQAEIAAELFK